VPEQRRADSYPATTALVEIGIKSLPNVLETIKADSSVPIARENAVAVVMQIYRNEPQKGVALLKTEIQQNNEGPTRQNPQGTTKRNLGFALYKAQLWCSPSERAQCKTAATAQ